MNQEKEGKKMGQIIAKAWSDDAFKKRLIADTATVLREEGIEIPKGVTVRAVENTDKLCHIVIPRKPSKGKLSPDELSQAAESVCKSHFCYIKE
jgi:hypothetical protein